MEKSEQNPALQATLRKKRSRSTDRDYRGAGAGEPASSAGACSGCPADVGRNPLASDLSELTTEQPGNLGRSSCREWIGRGQRHVPRFAFPP